MKLLKKSEVASQTEEIKRQQISEGTELVQRIGALRKALNELQEQQKHFVEKSKEELTRETSELYGQKEVLKADVASLTAVRAELQRPLDEEWKKLRDAQNIFERDKGRFTVEDEKLDARERELKVREARIDITLERAEKAQIESERLNKQAKEEKVSADEILKAANNRRESINNQIQGEIEELKVKQDRNEFERKGLEQIKKLQEIKENELNEKELGINDKYETLLRTEKRLNKAKNGK